jgi:hypothetical protein
MSVSSSSGTPTGAGSFQCTDSPGAAGTYKYKITATYGTWTTTSGYSTQATTTFGPATKLVFTTQPTGAPGANTNFPSQPVVAVEDASGNTVTSYTASNVTLAKASGANGTLAGCTSAVTPVSGVATFSGCQWTVLGNGDSISASGGSLASATSNTFNITGAASQLVFTTQTTGVGNASASAVFPVQPVVTVEDGSGNTVTSYSTGATLSISAGETLACTTNPVTPVNGVATFVGCHGSAFANGVTLTAASGGLPNKVSNTFNITGAASKLAFTAQPGGSVTEGTAFTQPTVTVEDSNGNTVTASSASITLAVDTYTAGNGGNTQGSVGGCSTNPLAAPSGVAVFSGCDITGTAGAGTYSLEATSTGLTLAGPSSNVTITAGAASRLAWSSFSDTSAVIPTGCPFACSYAALGGSASTFTANVSVTDAQGNIVSNIGGSGALSVTITRAGGSFTGAGSATTETVTIPTTGLATSNSGGNGTAGQIVFKTDNGSWNSDALTSSATGFSGSNLVSGSFSKN